jgi:DNA-binding transcriptional MerR regulator
MAASHSEHSLERPKVDRKLYPYRMRDLCERTGLLRQVIHFYIQQGLVPEGYKTGRNMAYYSEEHVERILLVRRLQHERFLPLRAIRALLDEQDEAFTPDQRRFVDEVKTHLMRTMGSRMLRSSTVPSDELVQRLGLSNEHVIELAELGILGAAEQKAPDGRMQRVVAKDDVWILETFAELRAIGFTEEMGFGSKDIAIYAEAMSHLLAQERRLLAERLLELPPDRAAEMIEKAVPIIHSFLARYHEALMQNYLTIW